MLVLLVVVPLGLGALALAHRDGATRPLFMLAGALLHALGVAALWIWPPAPAAGGYLALDAVGKLALSMTTVLFLACAVYAQGYLRRRHDRDNRVFVGGLLVLLAAMTAVGLAQHLGVMWVAIELTTLSTAPLIYFNHNARALEAAWKYLLVCSLGIALALLGTFFLALSGAAPEGPRSLFLADLVAAGPLLSKPWVRAGFVFLLVGYGTKMGLAPLHSWKPDAYGEAPGILGALLSGGVTTFAFVALGRVHQVCRAAGEDAFARDALVAMGLLSMAVAAVFMVGQRDFKRMLAWSSVEHMGILSVGLGLGGIAASGAFFHVLGNGLTKGVLFLSAGNIHRAFGSKSTDDVRGAARRLPLSGPLFLAGFLAITGTPPFGAFLSEFTILRGAVDAGRPLVAAGYLALLGVVFVGMATVFLRMSQGPATVARARETWQEVAPPLVLAGVTFLLGLYVPPGLTTVVSEAARAIGGGA
jgi:hydrogenase-4 component F